MNVPNGEKRSFPALNKLNEIKKLSNREFAHLRSFILDASGIYLTEKKRGLLTNRLAFRLHQLGFGSFGAYYDHLLKDTGGEELSLLIDRITTNETSFFRSQKQFDLLQQVLIPHWKHQATQAHRGKVLRIWSAGCSTGEEPYSVAMVLRDHFPPESCWDIQILATDISAGALTKAREGVWPMDRIKEIPSQFVKRFMLKGTGKQEGKMKVSTELQSLIHFGQQNLTDTTYPVGSNFDLILCRNVIIYFEQETGLQVIHNLLDCLAQNGFLFVGHSENLLGRTDRIKRIIPTVYAHAATNTSKIFAHVKAQGEPR